MVKSTNKRDQPYGVRLAGYETEKSKLPKDLTDQEYVQKSASLLINGGFENEKKKFTQMEAN